MTSRQPDRCHRAVQGPALNAPCSGSTDAVMSSVRLLQLGVDEVHRPVLEHVLGDAVGGSGPRRRERLDMLLTVDTTYLLLVADLPLAAAVGRPETSRSETWLIEAVGVSPEHRSKGLGKVLIEELASAVAPRALMAETDDEALGFYRSTGFEAVEVPSPWPGTLRYRCRRPGLIHPEPSQ